MNEVRQIELGQVYDLKEVAGFLRISYGKIYQMARSGQLRTFKVGKEYRINGEDVLRLTEVTQ